ncbi:MAG: A/G-specific adenine glycosylase [Candidatus Omnitrophica bacterium]|nr:A/G-specific adenine glycosylase [Candidatus Omnitrophota bacterium]MDE2223508.1 A/G-specific adenine glycosylase [Candidatus Omnitrophota bacterium]
MKLKNFSLDLTQWYLKHKRNLPWRSTRDPYRIWVSEIMLQQTTVATVIDYYERWIKIFPTVHDLAKAPLPKILKTWQGLGYYNRAKNLHRSARILIKDHQGTLPRDPQIIRTLPGFGPYTTGSVLSIAYDLPLTIIDANVRRVAMRLLALKGAADTKQDGKINEFLLKVLPAEKTGDFNQALMELGALVCRNKQPLCLGCPVNKYCLAHKEGKQEIIPSPKKKVLKEIDAVIAILEKKGKYFIQKRPSQGLLADLWEFPGGKIEAGESHQEALVRELKEELNIEPRSFKYLFSVRHFYTQFKVNLLVYACALKNEPLSDATHRWVAFKDLSQYPMPSGSAKIIEKL